MFDFRWSRITLCVLLPACLLLGCSAEVGPRDGAELPPNDPDRVQVGDPAPDFVLPSADGELVSLSDYQNQSYVVLVFYRGHW